ncbi:MAG: fumarylacetoacetate hydrolase family protein [Planctomycetota bacterium]
MPPLRIIPIQHGVAIETPEGSALPIRHVIGIGLNYRAHAEEQGSNLPEHPLVFTKNSAACTVHGSEIVVPDACQDPQTGGEGEGASRGQVDWEAELAVVIGAPCKYVTEADALAYVLGYCCANDVSARWWQKKGSGGQFNRGKSFDTFCPLGPALLPADEVPDPQDLGVVSRVNGEVMQDGTTRDMIFPVARLVASLSRGTTLLPGTAILTGTPSGVGMARDPQIFLQHGDTVDIEITGLGTLSNTVRWE